MVGILQQGPSPSSDGRTDRTSLMSILLHEVFQPLQKFNTFHRGSNHLNSQLEPRDSLSYAEINSPPSYDPDSSDRCLEDSVSLSRKVSSRRGWCPLWVRVFLQGAGAISESFSRDLFSTSLSFSSFPKHKAVRMLSAIQRSSNLLSRPTVNRQFTR